MAILELIKKHFSLRRAKCDCDHSLFHFYYDSSIAIADILGYWHNAFEITDVKDDSIVELFLRPAFQPQMAPKLCFAVPKLQLILHGSSNAFFKKLDAIWQAVEGQEVTLQDVFGTLNKLSTPIAASIMVGFDCSGVAVPMQQTVVHLLHASRRCQTQFQFEFDGHGLWLRVSGEEKAAKQIVQWKIMSRKDPRKGSCRSRCREMHRPKSVAKWVSALIGPLENASEFSVNVCNLWGLSTQFQGLPQELLTISGMQWQ